MFTRTIGVVFLCACGHGSTTLTIDALDPGPDAHADPVIGCADGVRDGFTDLATFAAIAAWARG